MRRAHVQKGGNLAWGRGGGAAGEGQSGGLQGAGADRQTGAAGGCGAAGQAGRRSFPPRWAWLLGAQGLRNLARPARTGAGREDWRASGESLARSQRGGARASKGLLV